MHPHIRPLTPADLLAAGHLHREAFPDDIRSILGARIIANRFKQHLYKHPYTYAIGAFDANNKHMLGYCIGGISGKTVGWQLSSLPLLALGFLTHPRLLTRINLKEQLKKILTPHPPQRLPNTNKTHYEIISLVVNKTVRNQGLGKLLMQQQENYAQQQHCTLIHLISPNDNPGTIAFYQRIGYQKIIYPDQPWDGAMQKQLSHPAHPSSSRTNQQHQKAINNKYLNYQAVK